MLFFAFLVTVVVSGGVGYYLHYKFGARIAGDAQKIRSDVRGL